MAGDAARARRLAAGRPVFLLTHLRYLGYCFNPISLFYLLRPRGNLDTVLAEVHSTFGESRNYWLSARNRQPSANALHYRCPKAMHVWQFMGMDLDYEFVLTAAEKLVAHMNTIQRDPAGESQRPFFDATLTLERRPWTSRNLGGVLLESVDDRESDRRHSLAGAASVSEARSCIQ